MRRNENHRLTDDRRSHRPRPAAPVVPPLGAVSRRNADQSDFCFLLLLAFGCTVCMCSLLNKAQEKISAFTIKLSFNLAPVYSIALAILLFREDRMLGPAFYAGLSLIALSLLLQMLDVT